MKNLFLASLVLISSNVFASSLVSIKTLSNPTLASATNDMTHAKFITHSGMKKVTELKGKGRTAQEVRQTTVAQALHTICPFFDDGVNIALNSKDAKGSLNAAADLIDQNDEEFKAVAKAVSTINGQAGVEVYSGSAGGNNTAGTVLGFYDVKNNEIAVFANTNCGSDD